MTNTPPSRGGIQFEVGAQLEACDSQKNWYCATIEKIDFKQERVLIHYRQWSHRYDEWFDWNSAYLRPLKRVQLRREGLQEFHNSMMFHVNQRVQVCWSDCRFYPARILQVNKDDSYTVKFHDGVVKKVKATKVKPFEKETGKTSQKKRNQEKNQSNQSETGAEVKNASDSDAESEEKVEVEKGEEDMQGTVEEVEKEAAGEKKLKLKMKEDAVGNTLSSTHPAVCQQSKTELRKRRRGSSILLHAKRKKPDSNKDGSSGLQTQHDGSEVVSKATVFSSSQIDRQASVKALPETESVLKRLVHLPTTHKYSREPLYRVIKNQPPPILSIELDHNPFKCQTPGCTKSFRKASLLHYHVKYYHEEDQLVNGLQTASQDTPLRTHTLLKGRTVPGFLSQRRKENLQSNNHPHGDRDCMETGTKVRQKRDRCFLRIMLKKKQKRSKSDSISENQGSVVSALQSSLMHTRSPLNSRIEHDTCRDGEDSDWSTVSAEWNEEEDLDGTSPKSQQSIATPTEDCDVVRCVCEVGEENDFLIQCDQCLLWQHGTCMGLFDDNVPEVYICYACRETAGQLESHCYWYDSDWLSSGHMFGLSCVGENYSEYNARKMVTTHQLLGDVQQLFLLFHGLQLKISILQAETHPDRRLWEQPWKQEESLETTRVLIAKAPEEVASLPAPSEKAHSVTSFQTSYISSEHCYQKTAMYYPGALAVETRGSELEHSLRRSEELIYGGPVETYPAMIKDTALHADKGDDLQCEEKRQQETEEAESANTHSETDTHTPPDPHTNTHLDTPSKPAVGCEQQQQWQLNLMDHIQAVQNQLTHRMDLIEKELDVLESWLEHTGELEPPDPLARLPQLKQRIRRLLTDLGTVQRIFHCYSSGGNY